MNIFQIIGWFGAASYLISYFLLSINKLKANSITYQLMNVIGGICLVISAYDTKDKPNLFTNFVWMCIGLATIISILKRRR
ncbi:CBU_0592 family membrane protein [Wocania ichthyoenteri]|uniref:CBU_0592 family membrane protein n=1 Tax=Wocania ichthyoenteri TaxID=1230531 RepID=UPI00068D8722